MPQILHPTFHRRVFPAMLLLVTPLLSGCFEVSNMHGQAQALNNERIELEKHVPIYDQHIAYYQGVLPDETKMNGGSGAYYQALEEHVQKVENELVDIKVNLARSSAQLKILRDESERQHSLQSAE